MPLERNSPPAERAKGILRRLRKAYPEARIALDFSTPLECVVATILSAQSTDATVNSVTPRLFRKYRRPEDYLGVSEEELQSDIHATGFFRQKTRSLRGMARKLLDDFGGEVPPRMAELVTLPGVARKTANIVQSNCFPDAFRTDPDAGIAVDTHVGRVAVRLGLTSHGPKEAERIEPDLMALMPRRSWTETTRLFIEHGRRTCEAKRPRCESCPVERLCPSSREAGLPDLYRARLATRPLQR
ncbi:MAG: endonuclease III [Actinomycetota bacterium]